MKILKSIILSLTLAVNPTIWAAHITSTPYPFIAPYPDFCVMKETGKSDVVSPVSTNTTSSWCNIDVSGVTAGTHNVNILARSSVWGDSVATPFQFIAGVPAQPSGLTLVP